MTGGSDEFFRGAPSRRIYVHRGGAEQPRGRYQARAAAAGKSVGVHGADTIEQCLNAGLLDEIHVDIAAVLLVRR